MEKERTEQGDCFYIDTTAPVRDRWGRKIFRHAPEIPFDYAAWLWQRSNEKLNELGRNNYQVIILNHHNDVTQKILTENKANKPYSNKYDLASTQDWIFPDGESVPVILSEAPHAKHLYIVSSILSAKDILKITSVANHYKETLGAKMVTLVCPHLGFARQDKNTNRDGQYESKPITLHAVIDTLSAHIDRFIAIEPHSSSAQSRAAMCGKPFFPVTPFEYLMTKALSKPVNIDGEPVILTPNNSIIVRPDVGRNIAAKRISARFGFESFSFNKKRVDGGNVELELDNREDQELIKGKVCLGYDDELSTNGTIGKLAKSAERYGARGLVIVAVHGKYTENWETNIATPFITKIYSSDSRPPIGNIKSYIQNGKIEVISIEPVLTQIIQADIEGTNFWLDPEYRNMILQETPEERVLFS